MTIEVGNVVQFAYNGKVRIVKIEKVGKRNWNTELDYIQGSTSEGYRTFSVDKIENGGLIIKV